MKSKYFMSSSSILNKLIFGTVEKSVLETASGTIAFGIRTSGLTH
jgi:hypothetical protein